MINNREEQLLALIVTMDYTWYFYHMFKMTKLININILRYFFRHVFVISL